MTPASPRPFLLLVTEFGDPELNAIFSESAYLRALLEVEVILARSQADAGLIPAEAAHEIARAAQELELDSGFWDETRLVGYPVLPLIRRLAAASGSSGGYVHWGATTQDIMDTALVLQLKRAVDRTKELIELLGDEVARRCLEHADTAMAGRTHGQRAVPITFGLKAAVWLDELGRHRERLAHLEPRLLLGQLGGAAGTLATLGADGVAIRERYCELLGLRAPTAPWHVARDSLGELCACLALIASTAAKIAREVANLARSEIGELAEEHAPSRGASSTMPQKRNPIGSEAAVGLGNFAASVATGMQRALQPEHERAAGEWQIEWDTIPLVCCATAGSLLQLHDVMTGLEVRRGAMKANLEADASLMSEAVMMALAPSLGRQVAHDVVYDVAQRGNGDGRTFGAELRSDARIIAALTAGDLDELLEPGRYIGESARIAVAAVAAWRDSRTPTLP